MKNQGGLSHIAMVIIIAILVIIGFVAYKFIMGNNGIIKEIVTEEEDFSQNETLEELNKLVKEKYLSIYNAGANMQTDYNTDVIIGYFEEKELLSTSDESRTYDENSYKIYLIDVTKLNRDITKNQIASLESNISSHSNEVYAIRRPIITNEDGTQALDKSLELCLKNEKDTTDWKVIGNITIDNPVSDQN